MNQRHSDISTDESCVDEALSRAFQSLSISPTPQRLYESALRQTAIQRQRDRRRRFAMIAASCAAFLLGAVGVWRWIGNENAQLANRIPNDPPQEQDARLTSSDRSKSLILDPSDMDRLFIPPVASLSILDDQMELTMLFLDPEGRNP